MEEKFPIFTEEMKKTHTILVPNMLPVHFSLIGSIMEQEGYKVHILDNEGPEIVDAGLKYVHNDMCYPAMLTTGQMLATMQSGKYDPNKVAMIITQSGGGCRDSNYINLMRKAFQKAGYGHVPFISANVWLMELNPGGLLSPFGLLMAVAGLIYGDMVIFHCILINSNTH